MTRRERLLRWSSLVLAVGSCRVVPPVDPDPSPPVSGTCLMAQERLQELDCPEQTTPGGTPFAEACERALDDGRDWCAGDISVIRDCSEVEAASRRCLP